MRELELIKDPTYQPKEEYSAFEQFWLKRIRDKRDLPFIYLSLQITVTVLPLAILLYLPFINGWVWGVLAVAYFVANVIRYRNAYTLMLHCTSHRPMFKSKYKRWNRFIPIILGPFMGQTPETYFNHHIAMHHLEGNLEDDDSTTMPYQRDSIKDFLRYLGRFFFFGLFHLTWYFDKKKRHKLRNTTIIGELSFIISCTALMFLNWQATLVVFIVPLIVARIIMMLGNWAQHAFVDPKDPGNEYKNSVTCINTPYNNLCWNDGYHISHHIKPTLHWTQHPEHLQENIDDYAKNKALVFEGIHFGHVWLYLMQGRYDKLAKHLLNLNDTFDSTEEAIKLMKSRTTKIPREGFTMEAYQAKKAS